MHAFLVLVITSLNIAAVPDDTAQAEMKKLQGNWVRVSAHINGEFVDDSGRKPEHLIKLKIDAGKFHDMTFTLDVTKTPRHINIQTFDDKRKPFSMPGIYELNGDELKVCMPFPFEGKFDHMSKRPTAFTSKRGGNDVLEVYRRVKP